MKIDSLGKEKLFPVGKNKSGSWACADMNSKAGKGFRNLVFTNDFNWRWMGYGRGGEMVQRYDFCAPAEF